MCLQSGTECRKLLVRLQSSEAFCGFLHGRRGPAQGHRGRSPSLHVAADATHGAHDILHDVGACERAAKFLWQAESRDGEDLVEALQNARRHARSVVFQPAREIADQLLGLLGVVPLPSLSQHAANSGMQRLRQPLHDVASLVNLAPLNQRLAPEAAPDRFRERLRTVDDEQPWHRRIEATRDEIVDQRLHHGGVLGRAFNEPERVLYAVAVDADRCHQHQFTGHVDAVDLHNQQVELGQVRGHPLPHAGGRERYKVARGRRLRYPAPGRRRNVALRQSDRTPKLARRHVDQHQVHRPPAEQPADIPSNPQTTYADSGWIGWGDWLGNGNVLSKTWRPFEEARACVHGLKLKSAKEYHAYCKSGNKPDDIPTNPHIIYTDSGWISWGDWLGN